ncbi:MAG: hypothetical protein F6K36_07290 [Symploca sp. SIO3C6]|uniref:Uncharacterized protein n=1 Tax=Symploca sp. SIO1C4 TaxID=2607765 RepID=A0A6B3NAH4_9CYAN|nr:hypothetical protein [Symploca sp. SIO3C6]NER30099.1 hypothetical protein [Symploca sp. SIO1C4]NET04024.1 hypothetical protein [Symploca sp. SIO2B6]NET52441.1 hypothetical protein [Merismopedia sp. SIO2A8]
MDNSKTSEVKQIASQLLAAMVSNQHIYPTLSDDGIKGQREQTLMILAIEMAQELIEKIEKNQKF